ncbi:Protein MTH-2 [Aphelenchoides avenae]|nr:Protein MTH-2 [Aphelenchus avenae]
MERVLLLMTKPVVVYAVSAGIPTVLCVLVGVLMQNFFYREDNFCWIRPDYVVVAVVVPLSLLVLNALFCSLVISIRLFPQVFGATRFIRQGSRTISKGARQQSKERFIALFLMQFTLGVPWVLQYLTLFAPKATAWHYLFTVVNGSQGIILFGLFVYKQLQEKRKQRNREKLERQRRMTANSFGSLYATAE